MIAKRDINGAFRLLWLDPDDVELFAGDIPWEPEEMPKAKNEGALPEEGRKEVDEVLKRLSSLLEELDMSEEEVRSAMQAGLTLIFLVLSFGWSGSPGEFTPFAKATVLYHRGHKPSNPRRDGTIAFRGKMLVDDAVLMEPLLGIRPYISEATYERGAALIFGRGAINEEKKVATPWKIQSLFGC